MKRAATEEQIAAWKKIYGEVYSIEIEGHVCYVKQFTRETMKYALSRLKIRIDGESNEAVMDVEKMLEIGEIGLQHGFIGGDAGGRTVQSCGDLLKKVIADLWNLLYY
ncbi:MAG: hypothetical protein LBD59_09220 [Prevotellaceae bacterium]|nr:hypothetical protein [Prevotellaceae bacterium]